MEKGKFENNPEGAKIELVMNALRQAQDTIQICYGQHPFPATNFKDEEMKKIYYQLNTYLCDLHARKATDYDKEKEEE